MHSSACLINRLRVRLQLQLPTPTRATFTLAIFAAVFLPTTLPAAEPDVRAGDFRPVAQTTVVPEGAKLELVWGEGEFTEGPAAGKDGAIYFTDIGNRIMRFDPKSGKTTVYREESGRANGLFFDKLGRLHACEGASAGNRRVSVTELDGKVRTLADRYDGKRFNSPNDLAIGGDGVVYFTDPRYGGSEPRELDYEGVFRVTPDGKVTLATREVERPNGILIAADGQTVYIADNNNATHGKRQLLSFAISADGTLTNKKVLYDFLLGRGVDGMTLDSEGNIYATAGTGELAGIYVFTPSGKPLAFLATPGDPTNCVFARDADSKTLYITSQNAKPEKAGTPRRYGLYRVTLAKPGYHLPWGK